jgi:hypothetical protein
MESMKVFLSSTCYDLKQVRSDIMDFLLNMGFTPVLSEYSNFPIDPDKNTIDNCIDNVKNNTDIFILIVGNRYGSQIANGKSITNTEYLYSKSLGIPTYIFIYKSVLTILPIWEKNKDNDFSNVVDSPKIFEFIQNIRETDKKWCFEFEKAQDIVVTLKTQLPHLFKEALGLQRKFSTNLPSFYNKLSPDAVSILLKRELAFDLIFFAQTLEDELKKHENLKFDLDYNIKFGSSEKINDDYELQNWLSNNLHSIDNFVESANTLINDAFKKFLDEPGVPSDLKGLYYVACGLARIFQELLTRHQTILSTSVHEDYVILRNSFAQYPVNSALTIWGFPTMIRNELRKVEECHSNGEPLPVLQITLKFDIDQEASESFLKEIERLKRKNK